MSVLNIGDQAPDFTLRNMEMKPVNMKDYHGKILVLAFFPGAYTDACRKELCTIRDEIAKLESLDAEILGISVNDPFTLKSFHEENLLNFPLASDYNRKAVEAYNVPHHDFAGLTGYTAAKRSVFIIDKQGKIRYIWITENPGIQPPYDVIKKELQKL
jgi:peroxiredoxin